MRQMVTAIVVAAVLAVGLGGHTEIHAQDMQKVCFIVPVTAATKQQVKTTLDGVDALIDPRDHNGLSENHPDFWAMRYVISGTEIQALIFLAINGDARASAVDLIDRNMTSAHRRITFSDLKPVDQLVYLAKGNSYWNEGCSHGWVLTPGVDPSLVPNPLTMFTPLP